MIAQSFRTAFKGNCSPAKIFMSALFYAVVLLLCACDTVDIYDADEALVFPQTQPNSMRVFIPHHGMEALYRAALSSGLPIQYDHESLTYDNYSVRFGPIDEVLEPEHSYVELNDGVMTVILEINEPDFVVSIRVFDGIGYQICRYRTQAEKLTISTPLKVDATQQMPFLYSDIVSNEQSLEFIAPQITPVGSCLILDESDLAMTNGHLLDDLQDYIDTALSEATGKFLAKSLFGAPGLFYRPIELRRRTVYENRQGELYFKSDFGSSSPITITPEGLSVVMDSGIHSRRARCAPSTQINIVSTTTAGEMTPSHSQFSQAHLGYALSSSLLQSLFQNVTRAGLMCTGMEATEDALSAGPSVNLQELQLGTLGFPELPVGHRALLEFAPGALPTIEHRPATNDLAVRWNNFGIDVYGEYYGVPIRLLHIETSLTAFIRPQSSGPQSSDPQSSDSGTVDFEIDTINVDDTVLDSDWTGQLIADATRIEQWTRRFLFIALEDRFKLPLPVEPGTPLSVAASQIRDNDLVLFLQFDSLE